MDWKYFNGYAAIVGILLPIIILITDDVSPKGWWPDWILLIWPSSFALISYTGVNNLDDFIYLAVVIGINGIIYGLIGALLWGSLKYRKQD